MNLQVQCAEELRSLAADPTYGNRAEDLEGLANAVADDDDDSWTGIDLFGAFPPDTAVSVTHKGTIEKLLGLSAGISVFLPVAWTWWSLRQASAAYKDVLADNGGERRTFLAMWTEGFGGRLEYIHQLVPMAMISVALIVLAMTLIAGHRLASQVNVTGEERRTADAQSRLVAALTKAQRCLNERRADDSEHLAGIVRRSTRKLREAHEDLQRSTEALAAVTERVSGELQPLFESATAASRELKEAALAAKGASGDLGTSASDLAGKVTEALKDLESGLDRHITELRDSTGSSLKELSDKSTSVVEGLTSGATDAVSAIGTDVTKLHEVVTALSTTNSATNTELHSAVSQLSDVISRLDDALLRHESALQGQATELTGARDAAERMLRQLENSLAKRGYVNTMGVKT